jgi:cyclopropane-fatty-acyl-phospholipid synthase
MENMATESSMTQASLSDSLARKILLRALAHLAEGHLTIVDGNQTSEFGNVNSNVHATMQVKHANFYRQVVFGGSIGAGEAYIQGHWSSPDLTKVVQIFAKNLALLDNIERYFSWLSNSVNRIKHVFNRNSEQGSKRNILAHYDLGNDMYKQFLDPEMMYSSALYPNHL